MSTRNRARAASRAALIAAVVLVGQGTSCIGPSVFVVQRFSLTGRPDTSFSFPQRVDLPLANYSLPDPKNRRWSEHPPRPICPGFHLYTADWPPSNLPPSDARFIAPPSTFEARLTADPEPTLTVSYRYHLFRNLMDSTTAEGAAQRAAMARLDSLFRQNADSLARAILAASGAQPAIPAAHVRRIESLKEFDRWCRAAAQESSGP